MDNRTYTPGRCQIELHSDGHRRCYKQLQCGPLAAELAKLKTTQTSVGHPGPPGHAADLKITESSIVKTSSKSHGPTS